MKVGRRINEFMKSSGIKQHFLAQEIGLPDATVSAMLNLKREIRVEEYWRICKALNVPLETFLVEDSA